MVGGEGGEGGGFGGVDHASHHVELRQNSLYGEIRKATLMRRAQHAPVKSKRVSPSVAKVCNDRPTAIEQDVPRRNVSMHYSLAMNISHASCHLSAEVALLRSRECKSRASKRVEVSPQVAVREKIHHLVRERKMDMEGGRMDGGGGGGVKTNGPNIW
jgi:hypothetical protein